MASRTRISRRTLIAGSAGLAASAGVARFNIAKAQSGALKIGVILPRSGTQAFIGQSCQRGADIAPAVLKELGYKVDVELINADSETNVDVARSRAERLIND